MNASEYARVYKGDGGLEITVVQLLPLEDNRALIEVKGIENEFDKLVIEHEIRKESRTGRAYVTQYKGKDFYTLRVDNAWRGESWTLWLPNVGHELSLRYDEEASKTRKPEDLVNKHVRLRDEGALKKVHDFVRNDALAERQARFVKELEDFHAKTDDKIEVEIDWSSISDEHLKTYAVESFMATAANGLERLLRGSKADAYRPRILDRIKRIDCRFGECMRITFRDGVVTWTTHPTETNQDDFAYNVLMNELNA